MALWLWRQGPGSGRSIPGRQGARSEPRPYLLSERPGRGDKRLEEPMPASPLCCHSFSTPAAAQSPVLGRGLGGKSEGHGQGSSGSYGDGEGGAGFGKGRASAEASWAVRGRAAVAREVVG